MKGKNNWGKYLLLPNAVKQTKTLDFEKSHYLI